MAPNVGLGTQGPDQKGWELWIVSVVGVVLAALFVAARLAQRRMMSQLGLDDYMIIASLVASGLLSMCECQAVVYGYGQKWENLEDQTRTYARQWFYGAQIMYKVVLMLNKIAIVCLYYRIFAVASLNFRRACHAVNVFIIAAGMAFIISTIFQCQPVSLFWDKTRKGHCLKEEPFWVSYSVIQITTDFLLLALPVQQVLTLSMTKVERAGLVFVFGTGLFTTFASIFRATTIARSANSSAVDPTQGPIPATVWSVIEANAGIICACLPMLRQPFLRIFGPLFPSYARSSQRRSQQPSYVLTSRSNPRNSAFPGAYPNAKYPSGCPTAKHDRFGSEFSTLDDEERIIETSHAPPEPGGGPSNGILVKNEIVVTRHGDHDHDQEDWKTMDTLNTEAEATQSVRTSFNKSVMDDKESGKSTFVHV